MNQKRLEVLYTLHYDALLSFAKDHLLNPEYAEDFVQETFLIFFEHQENFSVSPSPSLHSILSTLIYQNNRNYMEHTPYEDDFFEQPTDTPEKSLLHSAYSQARTRQQNREVLSDAFAMLSEKDQWILHSSLIEEETSISIARKLSIQGNAARKRIERSKKRLARLYHPAYSC